MTESQSDKGTGGNVSLPPSIPPPVPKMKVVPQDFMSMLSEGMKIAAEKEEHYNKIFNEILGRLDFIITHSINLRKCKIEKCVCHKILKH